MCARMCVIEREGHSTSSILIVDCVCVCVCVCVWEREWGSHHSGVYSPSEIVLFANTYEHHHCVCNTTRFSSRAWNDSKTKDIINCLYINFNNQSRLRLSEGGTLRKTKHLREAGHRGPTILHSIWKIMCFFNIKACQHILLHQMHKIIIFKQASYDPFNLNVFVYFRFGV